MIQSPNNPVSQSDHPAALGYRMPAEWEPHAATWLSWPRREGISFPGAFDRVMPVFRKMVETLLSSEPVCINVCNGAHEAEARQVLEGLPFDRLTFHRIPTNEPWCRDHGPIFLTRGRSRGWRLSIGITMPGAASIRRAIWMKWCRPGWAKFSVRRSFIRA